LPSPKLKHAISYSVAGAAAALAAGVLLAAAPPSGPAYEPVLPPPTLSGQVPRVVPPFPLWYSGVQQRPVFDVFTWQNFIALMWPAEPGSHGVPYRPDDPSVFGDYSGGRVPVWMTWKQSFDLFPGGGQVPVAWDAPNGAPDVCRNLDPERGELVLLRVNKFDTVADEVDQAFGGPLPDQTGLFTRYEVRIDRAEYDFIRTNGYYDKSNWPTGSSIYLPASNAEALGSIEVKAAWRDLRKVPEELRDRFFTTEGLVVDPKTCTGSDQAGEPTDCDCSRIEVGLVGFHIAHKTEDFPQWVWATFEQADNLGDDEVTPTPVDMIPSYYDPEAYRKYPSVPRVNPSSHPGSSRVPAEGDYDPTPINVVRLGQVPTTPQTTSGKNVSTVAINQLYRTGVLADSVWKYYFLVGSQWSTLPSAPYPTPQPYITPPDFGCEDGAAPAVGGIPFPQCLVANTTMETYHQYDSCQNCHQGAQRAGADSSWVLANRAATSTSSPSKTGQ
jgi:hypothetical protein